MYEPILFGTGFLTKKKIIVLRYELSANHVMQSASVHCRYRSTRQVPCVFRSCIHLEMYKMLYEHKSNNPACINSLYTGGCLRIDGNNLVKLLSKQHLVNASLFHIK